MSLGPIPNPGSQDIGPEAHLAELFHLIVRWAVFFFFCWCGGAAAWISSYISLAKFLKKYLRSIQPNHILNNIHTK